MPPALEGGVLTTGLPRSPFIFFFNNKKKSSFMLQKAFALDPLFLPSEAENPGWLSRFPCLPVSFSSLYFRLFKGVSGRIQASLMAQRVTSLPAKGTQEMHFRSNGNPLQCSCLRNPMDREAWRATVHGVAKSQRRLSTHARVLLESILLGFFLIPLRLSVFCLELLPHLCYV